MEDPEDMSDDVVQPGRVERKLLMRLIPAEMLSETMLLEGGGNDIDLGDYIEENYPDDWRMVSHTFELRTDGNGLLTLLVERPR